MNPEEFARVMALLYGQGAFGQQEPSAATAAPEIFSKYHPQSNTTQEERGSWLGLPEDFSATERIDSLVNAPFTQDTLGAFLSLLDPEKPGNVLVSTHGRPNVTSNILATVDPADPRNIKMNYGTPLRAFDDLPDSPDRWAQADRKTERVLAHEMRHVLDMDQERLDWPALRERRAHDLSAILDVMRDLHGNPMTLDEFVREAAIRSHGFMEDDPRMTIGDLEIRMDHIRDMIPEVQRAGLLDEYGQSEERRQTLLQVLKRFLGMGG